MRKIHEINIDGKRVFLRDGKFGLRTVYPSKIDGKINWSNLLFGGWENFLKLLFILLVIAVALYGFKEITDSCRDLADNPCEYCYNFNNPARDNVEYLLNYQNPLKDLEETG